MSTSQQLTEPQFEKCRELIAELTGIQMSEAKKGLVARRLSNRMHALGEQDTDAYLRRIAAGDPAEIEHFTNAVTTNLTSFFRENHHFDFLKTTFIPAFVASGQKTLRIWSAACSTGEEPYSIAITALENLPRTGGFNLEILATDIDSSVVQTAREGVYRWDRVQGLSPACLKRWFLKGRGAQKGNVLVRRALREAVDFRVMNLLTDWPPVGVFDIIFCRNVVIYFDKPTQATLITRFCEALDSDGLLIMGHSESLHQVSTDFRLLGRTIYKKAA
ncbi:MAG: protein-glutamate O-methyltransferase CheR [Pseudomonadota bacterium]